MAILILQCQDGSMKVVETYHGMLSEEFILEHFAGMDLSMGPRMRVGMTAILLLKVRAMVMEFVLGGQVILIVGGQT